MDIVLILLVVGLPAVTVLLIVLDKVLEAIQISTGAIQFVDEKQIVHEGAANHFMGIEGRMGRLTLTPDTLIFKCNGLCIQKQDVIIPLEECDCVDVYKYQFFPLENILPDGLRIVMKSGKEERFTLWGRKIWVEKIQKAMKESGSSKTLEKLMGQEPC